MKKNSNHPPSVMAANQAMDDGNIVQWDEHVLQVMRTMSISTEQAKQVGQFLFEQ